MKHPIKEFQDKQDAFLRQCPESEKEQHAELYRIGNAAYIYHQKADETNNVKLEIYYQEWLEGLPENIREHMKSKGIEECKTIFPFTRYVNERNDTGMDEWMKEHLPEEEYQIWKNNK